MGAGLLDILTEDERRWVTQMARRRRFDRNEVVFHEGDPGDTLHVIESGAVAVRVSTPLGSVATLTVLGAGDVFGELALVAPDSTRTATVVACEPTRTLAVHRREFEELRRRRPEMDRFLVDVLAHQVRRLSGQVLEALFEPADTRVLRRLLTLADAATPDGPVELRLTQDDLAAMAGTTRPTANRVLRAAETGGVLELARGRVRVLDVEALRARCR